MQVIDTISDLRSARKAINGTIGLVPTMGYLHEGHLSLVDYARRENDVVIATIFVNPTQFGQGEDLETYPRDLPRDFAMLEKAGVDFVFTPTPSMMYPSGYQTYVTVDKVTQRLEGALREGHFQGVATVVSKLFNLIQPDTAYFGQKDAQQVVVIRQFVRDLNFPVDIAICPIVREPDGLALSSRNIYLSADERKIAIILYQSIQTVGDAYDNGERNPTELRRIAEDVIHGEQLADLNYVSIANPTTLEEVTQVTDTPMLLSMAVKIGQPRLLDNCLLPLSLNNRIDVSKTLGIE
jgi:pantoate--beta-alanine ligase